MKKRGKTLAILLGIMLLLASIVTAQTICEEHGFVDDCPDDCEECEGKYVTISDEEYTLCWKCIKKKVTQKVEEIFQPDIKKEVEEDVLLPVSTPCDIWDVKAYFQPTQGAFQDDPTFKEKGQFLVKEGDNYNAKIPMVHGRESFIVGQYAPPKKKESKENWKKVIIQGKSSYTQNADVKVEFILNGKLIDYAEPFSIPWEGECSGEREWEIELDTSYGEGAKGFTFNKIGAYTLETRLVKGGEYIAAKGAVKGAVVKTELPPVVMRPLFLATVNKSGKKELEHGAERLSRGLGTLLATIFPLVKASDPVLSKTQDGSDIVKRSLEAKKKMASLFTKKKDQWIPEFHRHNFAATELIRIAESSAKLSGAFRYIFVVNQKDMDDFMYKHKPGTIYGVAFGKKVALVRSDRKQTTVAHELIHTLPYSWGDIEMMWECGRHFHNMGSDLANGFRKDALFFFDKKSVMSKSEPYLTQCTYNHLAHALQKPKDPPVIMISGIISKDGSYGSLAPVYQFDSTLDVEDMGSGNWSIVLKDADGRIIASYSFPPQWLLPDTTVEQDVLPFNYRIPAHEDIAQMELIGPNGLLDRRVFSEHAPQVHITKPRGLSEVALGDVRIAWKGHDVDGDELVYTILHSTDGGATWEDIAFELDATKIDIPIDQKGAHFVKIIITDGTQSNEDIVQFIVTDIDQKSSILIFIILAIASLLLATGAILWWFSHRERNL